MANPFIDALSRGGSTANQGISVANSIAGNAIRLFSVDNAGFRVLRLLERREQEKKMQELQALKTISDIFAQAQAQKLNEAKLREQQREFDANLAFENRKFNEGVREFNKNLAFENKKFNEGIRQFNEEMGYKRDSLDFEKQKFKTNSELNFAQLALEKQKMQQAQDEQNLDKLKLAKSIADKLQAESANASNTNLQTALKALQIMPNEVGGIDNVAKEQLAQQLTSALLTAQNVSQASQPIRLSKEDEARYKIYSSILKGIGMSNQAKYIDSLLQQQNVSQANKTNQSKKQYKKTEVDNVAMWTGLPNNNQTNFSINATLADSTRLRRALRSDDAIDTLYKGIENIYKIAKTNNIDPRANKYFMNFFKELYKTRGKDVAVRYIENLPATVTEKELFKKAAQRAAIKEIAQNLTKDNIDKLAKNYGFLGEELQSKLAKLNPETTKRLIKAVKGQNILGDIIRKVTPFLGKTREELAPKVTELLKKKELYFLKKYGVAPLSETFDLLEFEKEGDETPMQNALFVKNPSELLKEKEVRVVDEKGNVKETTLLDVLFGEKKFKGKNRFFDFQEYLNKNKLSEKERNIIEANIAKMANIIKDYKETHTEFNEDDKVVTTILNKDGKPIKVEMPIRDVLAFVLANTSYEVNKVQ